MNLNKTQFKETKSNFDEFLSELKHSYELCELMIKQKIKNPEKLLKEFKYNKKPLDNVLHLVINQTLKKYYICDNPTIIKDSVELFLHQINYIELGEHNERHWLTAAEVYSDYTSYCEKSGIQPVTRAVMGKRLKSLGIIANKSKNCRKYALFKRETQ